MTPVMLYLSFVTPFQTGSMCNGPSSTQRRQEPSAGRGRENWDAHSPNSSGKVNREDLRLSLRPRNAVAISQGAHSSCRSLGTRHPRERSGTSSSWTSDRFQYLQPQWEAGIDSCTEKGNGDINTCLIAHQLQLLTRLHLFKGSVIRAKTLI